MAQHAERGGTVVEGLGPLADSSLGGQAVLAAERRVPAGGRPPGYLRVDSVHQGDEDGGRGSNPINAVDCVTQGEIVRHPRSLMRCKSTSSAPHTSTLPQLPPLCLFAENTIDAKGKVKKSYP